MDAIDANGVTRAAAPAAMCVSCGATLTGDYCAQCGEMRSSRRDLTLRRFLRVALASALNVDARGYRSLRFLLTRPGLLTREHVAGRRRPYIGPMQLFFLLNVLFFFASPYVDDITLDTPLETHISGNSDFVDIKRSALRERFAATDTVDYNAFRARFNYASTQHAKVLFILLAPAFALAIAILRFRRREPAGQHLVFALHYLAFLMLLFMATGALISAIRIAGGAENAVAQGAVVVGVLAAMFLYLRVAFRTAYGSGHLSAIAQAVIIAVLFVPLLGYYRLMLFFTVLYSVTL